jgi:hypothetical protein
MIGELPRSLEVNGKEYPIRSDYRDCLTILSAFADRDLSIEEQVTITLSIMYKEPVPADDVLEAYEKAVWFLNLGNTVEKPNTGAQPIYSWTQDEQLIFSAVNKVAAKEVRAIEYLHFWTFMGLFNEIGEGSFATVISIRNKKRKNQKLEKWEKEFYRNNKDLVDLKVQLTEEEQAEQDEVSKLLGL